MLLPYRIAQYTPDMRKEDVEKSFRSALRIWSDMAPLTFVRVDRGKADIVLHFARKSITLKPTSLSNAVLRFHSIERIAVKSLNEQDNIHRNKYNSRL